MFCFYSKTGFAMLFSKFAYLFFILFTYRSFLILVANIHNIGQNSITYQKTVTTNIGELLLLKELLN